MSGGSGPNHAFLHFLKLPVAVAGLGYPGNQVHAPNENIREDQVNTSDKAMIANHGELGDDCAAHSIHCTVSPDAKSYVVKLPSQKHSRTFRTRAK